MDETGRDVGYRVGKKEVGIRRKRSRRTLERQVGTREGTLAKKENIKK